MDSYQGTHKRAYVNFGRAGKICLPIGISVTTVFFVATIVFIVLFAISAAGIDASVAQSELPVDFIIYLTLMIISIVMEVLGFCVLVPGIVFTVLSKSFRRKDEEKGISYQEFDK